MSDPTLPRSSGVLLHPTSLPGPFGVGDLGPEAHHFVEWLVAAKQSWWMTLPTGPTGAGNSPYQAFSAFAGNTALLSPEFLHRDGLIDRSVLEGVSFPGHVVAFEHVLPYKKHVLRQAWAGFQKGRGPTGLKDAFEAFRAAEAGWLADYALYAAVRDALGGRPLADWPDDLARRRPAALAEMEKSLRGEVGMHEFGQFLFERQWADLKQFANERGIRIIGDAPIFVSGDSADVWANPDSFLLDANRRPTVVAGVPPDYFSETGQHWGNPLYHWDRMEKAGYGWWVARLRRLLAQTDLVRLDHFRGFAAAWHIPAADKDARNGKWVPGPGARFFATVRQELGHLPLIAEDLGLITEDVHELREAFALPGMRVLQFALGGPDSPHWPHNFDRNTAVFTGTHDNDTVNGWYGKLTDLDRGTVREYLGRDVRSPAWDFIRFAWESAAVLAVAPLQDVLELGTEARMNVPGVAAGNWGWRLSTFQYGAAHADRLAHLTTLFNRVPKAEAPAAAE